MEIKGKIIVVQPAQTGEGRNGAWKKQEYVIEYDYTSQYPRKMMFNLWGDKIDQYNIQQGQSLKISFDIDCREYQGRWYNDIRAWKIEPDDETQADNSFPAAAPQRTYTPDISPADDSSELPF